MVVVPGSRPLPRVFARTVEAYRGVASSVRARLGNTPESCFGEEPGTASAVAHDPLYDTLTADRQHTAEGVITEWNGLNEVRPALTVQPRSEGDVAEALAYARAHGLKVSIAGARHSSGGQSIKEGSLHLDMTGMTGATYHPETQSVTLKAGTNWLNAMRALEPYGRSVAVKQEFAIFSVGGSVSVNCMGRDYRFGPIGNTVKSVKVMLADGSIVHASREENPELFRHVVGGFGLYGVLLEAELATVPNERYTQRFERIPTDQLHDYFTQKVAVDDTARIFGGVMSPAPSSPLGEVLVNVWNRDANAPAAEVLPPFTPEDENRLKTKGENLLLDLARLGGPVGKTVFWKAYTRGVPRLEPKQGGRNEALSPSYRALNPTTGKHAQALDVMVIPQTRISEYFERIRALQAELKTNIFLGQIYPVKEDDTAAVRAVTEPSYVNTLALDFARTAGSEEEAKEFYRRAADIALDLGGRFYLTHQLPFTREQVARAYPELARALAFKRSAGVDPDGLFGNSLLEQYG